MIVAAAAPVVGCPVSISCPRPRPTSTGSTGSIAITGEVSSCQYGLQEGTVGVTLCFGAGEGAGPQTPGEYGLVASRHEREGGVFRVNFRTGEMSICYVFDEKVVCTPQTNPSTAVASASQPSAAPTRIVRPDATSPPAPLTSRSFSPLGVHAFRCGACSHGRAIPLYRPMR